MANARRDIKKKWNATEGVNPGGFVRMPQEAWESVDAWIRKNAPDASRPEAIRQLVALGLKSTRR